VGPDLARAPADRLRILDEGRLEQTNEIGTSSVVSSIARSIFSVSIVTPSSDSTISSRAPRRRCAS
jgi:hypothetical protein